MNGPSELECYMALGWKGLLGINRANLLPFHGNPELSIYITSVITMKCQ
jgi:hypothetical protein